MTTTHDNVRTEGSHAEGTRTEMATTNSAPTRAWKTWPDWLNVVLGVYLALAPLWTVAAPAGWFVTLGILITVVGLWALGTASSSGSEWTQIVLGAVTFLAPWLGGFAAVTGAAWTAWIVGVLVIIFAVVGMSQNKSAATTTSTI